jgi:hypothetical protein
MTALASRLVQILLFASVAPAYALDARNPDRRAIPRDDAQDRRHKATLNDGA